MNNEEKMQSYLKKQEEICDEEWTRIINAADEMYKIWKGIGRTEGTIEIKSENIKSINKMFLSKANKAKSVKIYSTLLCEVCGKNIPKDFKYAEIQQPSLEGKSTITNMIVNIRKWKREDDPDFNGLDIKLIFWFVYGIMGIKMPKNQKVKTSEQEKMEEKKKYICLCAACMGMQIEEFSDVLDIMQYIRNDTLNKKALRSRRTKFLENFYSDIIENISDLEEREEDQEDIFKKWFKAGNTLIYVRTLEEKEVIKHIDLVVNNHPEIAENIYQWNASEGLINQQTGITAENAGFMNISHGTMGSVIKSISEKLDHNSNIKEIYIFRTIEAEMQEKNTVSRIKILAEKIRDAKADVFLIFLARDIYIDSTMKEYFYVDTDFYYLKAWKIRGVLNGFFESKSMPVEQSVLDDIVYSCKGLTTVEINRAMELAYVELNGSFDRNKFLQFIQDEKKQSLKKSGLLELIEEKNNVEDIGGLSELIKWLKGKNTIISDISSARKEHVSLPKGVLLVGMPGCGKSLCAKCAAGFFNIPLFRMDVGSLLGKYVGESEHNFSDALLLAEAASPCVLWIDEMEKAFPDDKNQSDVSGKMLGKFLTWMQEKKSLIFVVATVNRAKNIPIELTRHGRFDERFFVDFPDAKERAEIITLHLEKKGITFQDVKYIVKNTEGYSGAELEQIISVVTEERFINMQNGKGAGVTKAMFEKAIKNTKPISETDKEAIKEIKDYCKKNNIRRANKK